MSFRTIKERGNTAFNQYETICFFLTIVELFLRNVVLLSPRVLSLKCAPIRTPQSLQMLSLIFLTSPFPSKLLLALLMDLLATAMREPATLMCNLQSALQMMIARAILRRLSWPLLPVEPTSFAQSVSTVLFGPPHLFSPLQDRFRPWGLL